MSTMYSEDLRELSDHVLNNFGLNAAALRLLIKSYMLNCSPQPATIMFEVPKQKDNIVDRWALDKNRVEIHLVKPGFVGKATGVSRGDLDSTGLKLFARSYYNGLRPHPVSFLYKGIEVHLRTPGVSDSDKKNIARDIFNPTK